MLAIWVGAFVAALLLYSALLIPGAYSGTLSLIMVVSALFLVFYILRAIVLRKEERIQKAGTMLVTTAVVAAIMVGALYVAVPSADFFTTKEHYIEDINYVYNEDGTIKHNRDGEKVLDTDYGTRSVRHEGSNLVYLLFPIIGNGALVYGLVKTAKKPAQSAEKAETPKNPPKSGGHYKK